MKAEQCANSLVCLPCVAMDGIEKINFTFGAYDFDSRGHLNNDEANLLFRSAAKGLLKASPTTSEFAAVHLQDAEQFADLLFAANQRDRTAGYVSIDEFKHFCVSHPVVDNWLKTVSSLEVGTSSLPKPVVEGAQRREWVSTLGQSPLLSSSTVVRNHTGIQLEDITLEPTEEPLFPVLPVPKAAEGGGDGEDGESAPAPVVAEERDPILDISWVDRVDRTKPEELPPLRYDTPEDSVEPLWVGGINVRRFDVSSATAGTFAEHRMHRVVRYLQFDVPVETDDAPAPAGDAAEGEAPPPPTSTPIVYAAGNHIVVSRKNEESGQWVQSLYTAHRHPVSAMEIHYGKQLLVTADHSLNAAVPGDDHRLVVWNLATMATIKHIVVPHSVRFVDVNANGTLALVVFADAGSTVSVIDLQTGLAVFSRALLLDSLQDRVTDARFFGTSSMFAVGCAQQGVRFFVHEENHLMGAKNMHLYVERAAIFGGQFAEFAKAYEVTCMTRLEAVDEIAVGTAQGQIMVWRGRTLAQVVADVHPNQGSIQALDYHAASKQLVSGSVDGTVKVLMFVAQSTLPGSGNPSRGPKPVFVRDLQVTASYDILKVELAGGVHIASLMIHGSTERLLVATASREVVEVRNKIKPPTPEELAEAAELAAAAAEAAAAAAAEGNPAPEAAALPPAKGQLGEDLQNGPILSAHFLPPSLGGVSGTVMPTITKFNGNAFISAGGSDQTVRLWQLVGGDGDGAPVSYKVAKTLKFESDVSFVSASANLLVVALTCACGGHEAHDHPKHGKLMLYALPDVTFTTELGDNQAVVVDVKQSAEGNLLVALNANQEILVWAQTEGQWTLRGKLTVEAKVSGLDLSADNAYVKVYVPDLLQVRVYDISAAFGKELYATYEQEVAEALAKGPPAPVIGDDGEPIPPADDAPKPGAAIVEVLKGLTWATNNVPHAWDTKGSVLLHPPHSSGVLNLLPEHPVSTYALSLYDRSNIILASTPLTGAGVGNVFLGRVPVLKYQPRFNQPRVLEAVHMGPLAALFFFDEGNAKLLTAGAVDGTIRVFKVTYDTEEPEPDLPDPPAEEGSVEEKGAEDEEGDGANKNKLPVVYDSGDEEDYADGFKMKRHLARPFSALPDPTAVQPACTLAWANRLGYANVEECVKFSIKGLLAEDAASLPPVEDLDIAWVYGCTARSTRQAVRYTADNHVLYPAGTMLVAHHKGQHRQSYSVPHTSQITAMDYHAASGLAVTAHRGGAGHVYAFVHHVTSHAADERNAIRLVRTIDLGDDLVGVSAIAISPDADYVVLALQDTQHRVVVYSLADGVRLAAAETGRYKVLNVAFSDVPLSKTSVRIFAGGFRHFHLITFHHGTTKALEVKSGGFGGDVKRSHVTCVAALPMTTSVGDSGEIIASGNEFAVGLSDGTLAFLVRGEAKLSNLQAGLIKGGVTALTVARIKPQSGEDAPVFKIIAGGVGGVVKVLDGEAQPLQEFALYAKPEEFGLHDMGRARGIKSLQTDKLNRKLLYATAANEIGEIDLVTAKNLNERQAGRPLIAGHFRDELCALATHPIRQECLTGGDDKTLRVWNLETHEQVAILELPGRVLAGAFAPNGHLIVASLKPGSAADDFNETIYGEGYARGPGRMAVVSYLQGQIRLVYIATEPRDAITSLVFAPDGSKVYASSLDGNIYIYDALNNFSLLATLSGHAEGVVSLDITANGKLLISEGLRHEVVVWDTSMNTQVSRASDVFDQLAEAAYAFHTRHNLFGVNSQGIFPAHARKEHVRCLHQSHLGKLIATGDHTGVLRLYANPAIAPASPCKEYRLHGAAGVQRVYFSLDDAYLLSVGRCDKMMVQWKVRAAASGIRADRNVALTRQLIGQDKAAVEYALPSTMPEDAFDASFSVKGVNLRQATDTLPIQSFATAADGTTALATLTASQGVYHVSTQQTTEAVGLPAYYAQDTRRLFALPATLFCGQGELVTAQGQNVTLLDADGAHARVINQPQLLTPAASSQTTATATTYRGDVTALAVSPDGRYVAVGYTTIVSTVAAQTPPEVRDVTRGVVELYATPTGAFVTTLTEAVRGGVASLAFSHAPCDDDDAAVATASYLAVVGRDRYSTVQLFASVTGRWHEDATLLTQRATSALVSPLVTFLVRGAGDDGYDLVTGGQGRLLFWRIDAATKTVTCDSGFYGADDSGDAAAVTLTTAMAAGLGRRRHYVGYGTLLTGDEQGAVYRWQGRQRATLIEHHTSPIAAMVAFADAGFAVASAHQISIYQHARDGASLVTRAVSLTTLFSAQQLGWATAAYSKHGAQQTALRVTHLAADPQASQLLVSLAAGVTLQIAPDSGAIRRLLDGCAAPVYPVEQVLAYPGRPQWSVTVSSDGGVRIWDRGIEPSVVSGVAVGDRGGSGAKKNAFMHLIGHVQLPHPVHSALFVADDHLLVSQFESDALGGSSSIVSLKLSVATTPAAANATATAAATNATVTAQVMHRLYAIGKGRLTRLRWSDAAAQEYLAACCEDGCVYLFVFDRSATGGADAFSLPEGRGQFVPMGFLLAHANSTAVRDVDFSRDGRHVRTVGDVYGGVHNRRTEVTYFTLQNKAEGVAASLKEIASNTPVRRHAGLKVSDATAAEMLRMTMYGGEGQAWAWHSAHALVVPELCGVHYAIYAAPGSSSGGSGGEGDGVLPPKHVLLQATSVSVSADAKLVAVGYEDGAVRVFRFPVFNPYTLTQADDAVLTLPGHGQSPVHVAFHAATTGYRLVTAGQHDGLLFTWNIEA